MIVVEKEKTIRKCLTELCEQKSMTLTTYDVFVGREKQVNEFRKEILHDPHTSTSNMTEWIVLSTCCII